MRLLHTKSVGQTIAAAALCPSMDLMAVATGTHVSVYRLRSQSCILAAALKGVTSLAWSPGARLLAAGKDGGTVCLLHADTGEVVRTLRPAAAAPPGGSALGGATSRATSPDPAAGDDGSGAPTTRPISLTGPVVSMTWIPVALSEPLVGVGRRALSLPTVVTSTRASTGGAEATAAAAGRTAGQLALLQHALRRWQESQAALLAVADSAGNVSLILEGIAEVWILRYPALAGRIVAPLRATSEGSELVITVAPHRSTASTTGGGPGRPSPAAGLVVGRDTADQRLSLVDLSQLCRSVTAPSALKGLLVAEFTDLSHGLLAQADASWTAVLKRVLAGACGGADLIATHRAALLGYLFRPQLPHCSESHQSSRAGSVEATSAGGGDRSGRSYARSPSTLRPRAATPGNRGAGRAPPAPITEATGVSGVKRPDVSQLASLREQLHTAFAESVATVVDQARRAHHMAHELSTELVPLALVQQIADGSNISTAASKNLAKDERMQQQQQPASGSRRTSPSASGRPSFAQTTHQSSVTEGATKRRGLQADRLSSCADDGVRLEADGGSATTALAHVGTALAKWVDAAAAARAGAAAFLTWLGSCLVDESSAIAAFGPAELGAAFRVLTLVIAGEGCPAPSTGEALPDSLRLLALATAADELSSADDDDDLVDDDAKDDKGRDPSTTERLGFAITSTGYVRQVAAGAARVQWLLHAAEDFGRQDALFGADGDDVEARCPELHDGLTCFETVEASMGTVHSSKGEGDDVFLFESRQPSSPAAGGSMAHPSSAGCVLRAVAPHGVCTLVHVQAAAENGCLMPGATLQLHPLSSSTATTQTPPGDDTLRVLAVRRVTGLSVCPDTETALVLLQPKTPSGDVRLQLCAADGLDEDVAPSFPTLEIPGLLGGHSLSSSSAGHPKPAGVAEPTGAAGGVVQLDVAPLRGFALLTAESRFAVVDLEDDATPDDAMRGSKDSALSS